MSGKNSIQVGIKVRPLLKKGKDQQIFWRVVDNSIQLLDSPSDPYYFGKTYTMMGDEDNPGVMVLAAKEIFKEIERTKDRQFLLRVGYIEIYNEKICDLLNKKNQDLKIHETSTGIVSVNCEEMIIRSEDDLLNHLEKGGKERTVGETNMNERSSRSHAIFRIIIESRKIDRSDDDAIIQSVINLVDLAGSERADQTGARGTRLKEGGYINKSLFFLSNVIKRLSENEDDNFALRAKTIKNKPQVNETVSDATMMKRLEHEIKVLKTRLEEEQRKNESQLKVRQLEQRIKDEDLKIISCNSLHSIRNREKRRRTWCPSSMNMETSSIGQPASSLPLPSFNSMRVAQPSRLLAPKAAIYNTLDYNQTTNRSSSACIKTDAGLPVTADDMLEIEEEFAPAELVDFDSISPLPTPTAMKCNVTSA
ncbi:Kinesin-like protein KIN-7N [Eumeta japonica]|uniref:Kinesin-like protein n=1 Tax=Eumeta variegata TaxID=151549 RepID=A0A4C1T487_EUMVA|nr:Kinesin-like protein KIN-7N [Eumeta japonica]